jgi:Cu-processing system permease protein
VKSVILIIGWQELVLSRRNRWVISFSILFAGLTLLVAYFGMITSGYAGFQDFTRTSASIVNLGGFLVPLFALLLGVFSFLTHGGYLEIMITQPVPRSRVLLGKYLGLVLTVVGSSALGFGLPGVIMALNVGVEGALSYLAVVFYACLLAIVFVGLSLLIALLARRREMALGIALGVWIFFEVLYGLLMLGTTLYFSPGALKTILLLGLLGNPIDISRVLSLLQVGGPHLFGPAGATLMKLVGSTTVASLFGLAGLAAWIVGPLLVAIWVFNRQDL